MAEPRSRRPARPREEVLAVAMAAIAEHGLAKLTMAGLGKQLGMSAGHLLYYFGSKDQLLLETLRWSEDQLGERRRAALGQPGLSAWQRFTAYAELYLADGPGDPRWILWVEVWGRSPASEEIRQGQLAIEAPWQADLAALIEDGVARREFRPGSAEERAAQLRAVLDGFSVPLAIGLPGVARESSAAQVSAVAAALLKPLAATAEC
ncbi:TetR/AcrR family transcriptional regulator [Kitasatospora sp. NBC_01250]|uniref:TetR/AcrR family transcriptional regulator n=1 Tax=unclassified Kitasatospora TaxID=2633591 RepID=UPI002E0EB173|nr:MULTISPECIES: TetR/AcrR family transcriptional regulator [unclassified Kitasatospora]WSJ70047.1 TetR/AcrR family transcriptional regulator [Kitasatospora sp. NBC_01302]